MNHLGALRTILANSWFSLFLQLWNIYSLFKRIIILASRCSIAPVVSIALIRQVPVPPCDSILCSVGKLQSQTSARKILENKSSLSWRIHSKDPMVGSASNFFLLKNLTNVQMQDSHLARSKCLPPTHFTLVRTTNHKCNTSFSALLALLREVFQ